VTIFLEILAGYKFNNMNMNVAGLVAGLRLIWINVIDSPVLPFILPGLTPVSRLRQIEGFVTKCTKYRPNLWMDHQHLDPHSTLKFRHYPHLQVPIFQIYREIYERHNTKFALLYTLYNIYFSYHNIYFNADLLPPVVAMHACIVLGLCEHGIPSHAM
jgi:hypothetical protein